MALRDDVDSKKASKLAQMRDAQDEAQSWIEAVTGQTFDGDFADFLKDGKALCALVNAVEPGTIKKVSDSKLAFKQMENISNFTRAAKNIRSLWKVGIAWIRRASIDASVATGTARSS